MRIKDNPRIPEKFLPVRGANVHNLKNVDIDISLGQPLSTFSGGERQRVKLADYIIDVGPEGGNKGGRLYLKVL